MKHDDKDQPLQYRNGYYRPVVSPQLAWIAYGAAGVAFLIIGWGFGWLLHQMGVW